MDFSIPDALEALLQRAQEFMDREVYPLEEAMRVSFEEVLPAANAARDRCKSAGLWAPQMPPAFGGMGLDFLPHAYMSEVLGRSPLGHYVFGCQAPDAGNMEILHKFGTEAQQERWLQPLAAGRIRSCFSMTEPDRAGSNPTWLETTAVRDGDDYVINGRKWFTTGGHLADFAIVMAVTNPEAAPHMRASQIIVPTDNPGFQHLRRLSVMGEEGYGWNSHSEVAYENCRVPVENLLGQEGFGFMIAQERLGPGRIHHCMRWLGICERAFDLTCERAAHRMVGRDTPLGSKQAVQHWIADSRAEIDAARLMVYRAAWRIDRDGARAARNEISAIKFFAAGVLQNVLDRAIQVHGALGMTDETPLAWFFRHERAARIYDGPDEVHKTALARSILKKYGIELGSQGS